MTIKLTKAEAYARGREAAQGALGGRAKKDMQDNIRWARASYLGLEGVDLEQEVLAFSRESPRPCSAMTNPKACFLFPWTGSRLQI